jgi:hypothetical protein
MAYAERWMRLLVLGFLALAACGGTLTGPPPDGGAEAEGGVKHPACAKGLMKLTWTPAYSFPVGIAVDDENVYWLANDGNVYRVLKNGGGPVQVFPNPYDALCTMVGCGFAADATDVYFSINDSLHRVSKATLAATTLLDPLTQMGSNGVALDAANVYVTTNGGVAFAPKDGGDAGAWTGLPVDQGENLQLAVGPTDAFVTTMSFLFENVVYGHTGLWRVPLDGTMPLMIAGVTSQTTPLTLDGATLYMVDYADPRVVAVDTTSGAVTKVGDVDPVTGNVAVDASFVYWPYDHDVWAVPKAGGPAVLLPTADPLAYASVVAVDDACVFWIESVDGTTVDVMGAPKPLP